MRHKQSRRAQLWRFRKKAREIDGSEEDPGKNTAGEGGTGGASHGDGKANDKQRLLSVLAVLRKKRGLLAMKCETESEMSPIRSVWLLALLDGFVWLAKEEKDSTLNKNKSKTKRLTPKFALLLLLKLSVVVKRWRSEDKREGCVWWTCLFVVGFLVGFCCVEFCTSTLELSGMHGFRK